MAVSRRVYVPIPSELTSNPRKNEMEMGFAISAGYGFPAFVALTFVAFANWSEQQRTRRLVLLVPTVLALFLFVAARWFSTP